MMFMLFLAVCGWMILDIQKMNAKRRKRDSTITKEQARRRR